MYVALTPFACADKPAEKYCWLICCERKTLFWLKKQAEKYVLPRAIRDLPVVNRFVSSQP
jgi:hypothetical protein